MNEKGKNLAEVVLERLCRNASISGIRFGPILQILINNESSNEFPIKGQVYINLSSRWKLFDSRPLVFPTSVNELSEMTTEEEILTICSIRDCTIENVEIGEISPHLILTLDNRKTIFVNGKDDEYESWDVGVAFSGIEEAWQVIACPSGEVAIFTPPHFDYPAFSN